MAIVFSCCTHGLYEFLKVFSSGSIRRVEFNLRLCLGFIMKRSLTWVTPWVFKNYLLNTSKDPWAFTKKFRHVRQDVFNKITECEIGCFVTVTIVTPGDLDFILFYEQTVSWKLVLFIRITLDLKFQFLELYRETYGLLSVIIGTWDSGDFIIIENWLSGELFDLIWNC